jgi:hypothetical protein
MKVQTQQEAEYAWCIYSDYLCNFFCGSGGWFALSDEWNLSFDTITDSSTDRFWVKMLSAPCIHVFEEVAHFFCPGSQTVVNSGNSPFGASKIFEESVSWMELSIQIIVTSSFPCKVTE